MSIVDEIIKNREPNIEPNQAKDPEGLVWVNMLIKFNYVTGQAQVLRSFSKPAKESTIKQYKKPKEDDGPKIEIKTSKKKETLF